MKNQTTPVAPPLGLVIQNALWESGKSIGDYAAALNIKMPSAANKLAKEQLTLADLDVASKLTGIKGSELLARAESYVDAPKVRAS